MELYKLSKEVCFSGGLILAADYSQLELRILAHLSRDCRLIQVLNSGADVFRSIAAEWKMLEPDAVGDDLRQQAKQVSLVDKLHTGKRINQVLRTIPVEERFLSRALTFTGLRVFIY